MAKWPSYLHTNKKYVYTMTAVEWLKKELEDYGSPTQLNIDWEIFDELCEQAKRIEKQQTERDFLNGYKHGLKPLNHDVIDNYYNETYGK